MSRIMAKFVWTDAQQELRFRSRPVEITLSQFFRFWLACLPTKLFMHMSSICAELEVVLKMYGGDSRTISDICQIHLYGFDVFDALRVERVDMDEDNRMLRLGFGKHEGAFFFRIDLWYVGWRFKKVK